MTTITERLAAALRAGLTPTGNLADMQRIHAECAAVLAEYDARRAGPKEVPVCAYCGSTEVSAETSLAYWDVSEQAWKVSDICDKGHYCNDCESETRLDWRQATPEEIE